MFFGKKTNRFLSVLMASSLVLGGLGGYGTMDVTASVSETEMGGVLEAFQNPDYSDRPMARMWFPDAGAGIDDYDTIEEQINALAESGWGGVEVTMLSNATKMTIEEAATIGWGTEAWKEVLKKVLRAANATEDGFIVDITMTDHWPIIINSVDPNDDAASQEIAYTVTKLTEDQLDDTDLTLSLPETKLYDNLEAPFITVDKFVSAALVKVASVSDEGVVYDFDSMIDISGEVTSYGGHAAGIPDADAIELYYSSEEEAEETAAEETVEVAADGPSWATAGTEEAVEVTVELVEEEWGTAPAEGADLTASFNGKMDADGNRARMADWQYDYEVDMSAYASELTGYEASEGEDYAEGDYVLVTTYRRGTGQNLSEGMFPSIQMYGRTFTTNYFHSSGIEAVTSYWEENLLDDEMVALMQANGGSIFEDSLEASTASSFWSQNILEELDAVDYAYATEMPVVVALGAGSFDSDEASRVSTDYSDLLGDLFESDHLSPISDWAATLGYTFRAQAYGLTGVDDGEAATYLDIAEGDNAKKGDGLRLLAGSTNMDDHEWFSMEAVTGMEDSKINWADIITELNQNFSDGVNHVVFHGTPYNKSFNGYYGEWPGWVQFDGAHCGSYTYRQAYWEDVSSMAGYISRVQAVMATGLAKVDLAVLEGSEAGNGFQELLDNGYSYNLLSKGLLDHENATVSNGQLYEDGPGYKALIVNSLTTLNADELESISDMVSDGLPVIFYNCSITGIEGTEAGDDTDSAVVAGVADLMVADNVYEASSESELLELFNDLGVDSEASYDQEMLESTKYVDTEDGSSYYLLFNNPYPENNGMVNAGQNSYYKSGETIETTVTLTGEGIPYVLDAWTGDMTKVAEYTDNGDGTMSMDVEIAGGDIELIALLDGDEGLHAVAATEGDVVYDGDDLTLKTNEAGAYAVELSDGSYVNGTVSEAYEAFSLAELDWDLELISFGPDYSDENIQSTDTALGGFELYGGAVLYKDPSAMIKTTVNFNNIQLGDWSAIEATQAQLDTLDVESMDQVAGIGYYTTTFFTPDDWADTVGAEFELTYSQDMVTEITINGHTIDTVNIISDKVDIGSYLNPGAANTLTVKLITPMFNRVRMEHSVYDTGVMSWKQSQTIAVGLLDVVVSPYTQVALVSETEPAEIMEAFSDPDVDAKPMARMWFADAGAGETEEGLAMVAKQINDMAEGGFGGVEIAYISDSSEYDNEEAAIYGWGTEYWQNILKEILKTANAIEDGFKVDITITTHWPPTVNNIDPNDDEAAKEAVYEYVEITAEDLESGVIQVPLPEQKVRDYFSPMMGGDEAKAHFLFVDKLISANLAKVASIDGEGNPIFEFESLEDVTTQTTVATTDGAIVLGYAAGIPDQAYCDANDIDYQLIVDAFGDDPEDPDFDGKIDEDGNRKRMADWQYIYETDLTEVSILDDYAATTDAALEVGDYVLFGNYYRGTGQVVSGGASVPIVNRCYAVDYFSEEGVNKVFEFWDEHILDDEMIALLKENGAKNGTSIFEDSIEIHHEDGPIWTANLMEEFENYNGYDGKSYVPILTSASSDLFDDSNAAERIIEDYNIVLGDLYANEHAANISDWADDFNYTYRAQGYTLTGLDVCGAALALDIPEGDNSTAGDGVRQLASAVNMSGDKMLSMESTTFSANIFSTWVDVVKELNGDFSDGINRSILHGSAFARTFNGYDSAWPGWNFLKGFSGGGFSSWNARQIYWDDVDTVSGYMARTQAVMQNGQAKVDLAVLIDSAQGFNNLSGNSLQEVLDLGYSYNIMSEPVMMLDTAVVEDGVLSPDGPGYKAVIVQEAEVMSVTMVEKLTEFAENGLPVIMLNSDIDRVYGTDKEDNNDADLLATLEELTASSNVVSVSSMEGVVGALMGLHIDPSVEYNYAGLETSHRISSEGDYYYFFNDNSEAAEVEVTINETGTPYVLDAWTGEISPIMVYEEDNQTITMTLDLEGKDAAIIGVIDSQGSYPDVPAVHAIDMDGGDVDSAVAYENDRLMHKAEEIGTFTVGYSDKSEVTFNVKTLPDDLDLNSGWDLILESWGPSEAAENLSIDNNMDYSLDPTISVKTQVSFENIDLDTWANQEADDALLETLGVESMAKVSGIGYYATTIELGDDWTNDVGAYMDLTHGSDMIVEVTVNGTTIDDVDQFTNRVDLGNALKSGLNTIEIKLDTTLMNRGYSSGGFMMGGFGDGDGTVENGLTGITIETYAMTQLKAVTDITVTTVDGTERINTKGGELQLTAAVEPYGALNKDVIWSVEGTGATITADGLLKAVSDGVVTVVAEAADGSEVSGEIDITISRQTTSTSSRTSTSDTSSTGQLEDTTDETETAVDTSESGSVEFTDLDGYDWAAGAITELASLGVIKGVSEDSYAPASKICRADFILLLTRALELNAEISGDFDDIEPGDYYYDAVCVAKEIGITNGMDGVNFEPKGDISRQDLMVMVHRALELSGAITEDGSYDDIKNYADADAVADYALEAVASMVHNDLIKGDGTSLNPDGTATRAEVAVIMQRIMNKKVIAND